MLFSEPASQQLSSQRFTVAEESILMYKHATATGAGPTITVSTASKPRL